MIDHENSIPSANYPPIDAAIHAVNRDAHQRQRLPAGVKSNSTKRAQRRRLYCGSISGIGPGLYKSRRHADEQKTPYVSVNVHILVSSSPMPKLVKC